MTEEIIETYCNGDEYAEDRRKKDTKTPFTRRIDDEVSQSEINHPYNIIGSFRGKNVDITV